MNHRNASNNDVQQRRPTKPWNAHGFVRRLRSTLLLDVVLGVAMWGCDDGIQPQDVVQPAPDPADQMLINMTHQLTRNGIVRAKVEADTTYMHTTAGVADLRNVRVTFYDAQGNETSTLTSNVGTYQLRSGDMEGRGDVVVLTQDGRQLTTEVLRYVQAKDSVFSDVPFVFDSPGRHIEGEGFVSDPSFRTVIAKQPRGTGGRFVLPNQ